jgi:hypothetical protein
MGTHPLSNDEIVPRTAALAVDKLVGAVAEYRGDLVGVRHNSLARQIEVEEDPLVT